MAEPLPNRWQRPPSRGDDRERITRARQAAEALFAPKQPEAGQSASGPSPSAEQPARKPRVLGTASAAPVRQEAEAEDSCAHQAKPEIPVSQYARIRALVTYGMTVSQVAELYEAAVGEIERILRTA
jgi:hypothetical protein